MFDDCGLSIPQFPAHPEFGSIDVKPAVLKKVQPVLEQAAAAEGGRVAAPDRAVRQLVRSIADPLKLGQMGETHFVLGHHWKQHFDRLHAQDGGPITVAKLRRWIDQPQSMGMPREVANLVILTFADQTNRSFFLRGGRVAPTLEAVADDLELREEALPSKDDWTEAVRRAQFLFGLVPPETLNATNVGELVSQLRAKVGELKSAIEGLCRELPARLQAVGLDLATADRLITARSAQALVATLSAGSDDQLVSLLATAELKTSDAAMSQTTGAKAKVLDEIVRMTDWELFDAVGKLADGRKTEAQAITGRVREALKADEHAIALKPVVNEAKRKALKLLTQAPAPPPLPPPPPPQPPAAEIVEQQQRRALSASAGREVLKGIDKKLDERPDYRLDIEWTIRKGGNDA